MARRNRVQYALRGGKWVPVTSATASPWRAGIRGLANYMAQLEKTAGARVAASAAPDLTRAARAAYTAGQTVYGDARERGVDGSRLTLRKSGDTFDALQFRAIGNSMRVYFSADYVKYLIGKYKILPIGNSAMPAVWRDAIRRHVAQIGGAA